MTTTNIGELEKLSLRERVRRGLKAAVVSGELEPGVVYSAPSLAIQFGVSATPVREAMLDLIKEGLVTIVPNKGFRVAEVDDAAMDQISQIRLLLEPPTVAAVTPSIPRADLPKLRRLARAIVTGAERGDLEAYTGADTTFHLTLLAYSGNTQLVDLVADLRGRTRLTGLARLAERHELAESAREHLTIVDLIEAGDPGAVERYVYRHIAQTRTTWAG